ncbi:UNVERIFIED_CONTAM: hypothetical protein FKN15_042291 [Acipenser sinensis]
MLLDVLRLKRVGLMGRCGHAGLCAWQREKKRTLFLYNEQIRKRITYVETQRKRIMMRARVGRVLMMSMLQIIPLAIFIGTLLAIDWSLYKIFRVIRKHSYTEYSFSSCLPDPQAMSRSDYLWTTLPILAMTLLCCLQVYTSRLRRVIASFYFPQREKKRTLFLYNEQIRKRITYVETQRKRIMMRARVGRVLSRLSFVCPAESCGTVYCRQCWKDMRQFCFACTSFSEFISDDGDSEYDMKYAH